jgi:hypothetical protein
MSNDRTGLPALVRRAFRQAVELGVTPLLKLEPIKRNEDFLDASLKFALAETSEERDQAALRFLTANARRQLQRIAPQGISAAKGRAKALLEVEAVRHGLERTDHLGALATLSTVRPTRLDYVALILDQLLQLKVSKSVTGLGSKRSDWPKGTTLELMQTWAVLHNWGHLFGTFATERGLLYRLDSEPAFESEVFSNQNLHPRLRDPVREVVGRKGLFHFFYALAALRASTELTGAVREDACAALAVFFDHRREQTAEFNIYRRVRQLAYHRLHSIMGLERTCDFTTAKDLVAELFEHRELRNDEHTPIPPLVALLTSFDAYQAMELFTSPRAAALVLNHNRVFKRWWADRSDAPSDRVRSLFLRPSDWPLEQPDDLKHWLRVRFAGDGDRWIDEVRAWSRAYSWTDSNYLVSPVHGQNHMACDLYLNESASASPALYFTVARNLAIKCAAALNGDLRDEDLGRSIGLLIAASLRELLQPGLTVVLERAPGMKSTGWAVALMGDEAARQLRRLAEQVDHVKRRDELRALVADIERHQVSDQQVVAAIVGATRIVDDETGQEKKEIDGVWAALDGDVVSWRFIEEKTRQQCGREAQLLDLRPLLSSNLTTPERMPNNIEAAVTSCVWPGRTGSMQEVLDDEATQHEKASA